MADDPKDNDRRDQVLLRMLKTPPQPVQKKPVLKRAVAKRTDKPGGQPKPPAK